MSGTTGVSVSEKLFSARINSEGTLDDAYGTSGINIIDGISGKVIDAYSMSGDKVIKYLATSGDIKLRSFISDGVSIRNPLENFIGWEKWLNTLKPTLKVKQCKVTKKSD